MTLPRPTRWLLSLLIIVTSLVGACGGGSDPVDPDPTVETIIRLNSNLTFSPASVTIEPGTRVRWVNETNLSHTVTPNGHSEWARWATSGQGQSFTHTFETAGTFDYFCEPHVSLGMSGIITVQ